MMQKLGAKAELMVHNTKFKFVTEDEKLVCFVLCPICCESLKISNTKGWSLGNFYRHLDLRHPDGKLANKNKSSGNLDNWVKKTSPVSSKYEDCNTSELASDEAILSPRLSLTDTVDISNEKEIDAGDFEEAEVLQ